MAAKDDKPSKSDNEYLEINEVKTSETKTNFNKLDDVANNMRDLKTLEMEVFRKIINDAETTIENVATKKHGDSKINSVTAKNKVSREINDTDVGTKRGALKINDIGENNEKDLKNVHPFDFNSADEIRTAMKDVLFQQEPGQVLTTDETNNTDNKKETEIPNDKSDDKKGQNVNVNKPKIQPANVNIKKKNNKGNQNSRKRKTVMSNGGPAKKRKFNISKFYEGKLANVVFLKKFGAESDSDFGP